MKKISVALLIAIISMSGCEDILEKQPLSTISPDNFYKTEQDVNAAVVAMYNSLIGNDGVNRNIHIILDANSDDLNVRNGTDRVAIDRFSHTPDNSVLSGLYASFYRGIGRTNDVLLNVSEAPVSDEIKRQAEGEALFLRGLYYFYLVRWFGPLPLITEPITSPENTMIERSPVQLVYEQIINDLEGASDRLPLVNDDTNKGRATKGAAETLLAKVHVTLQNWEEAKTYLESVINSNEYGLFDTYHEIFYPENKNTLEHIFMIQHLQNASSETLTGGYMTSFFPQNSSLSFATFFPTTGTTGIYSAYEEGDLRKNLYLSAETDFSYKGNIKSANGILVDNAGDSIVIDRVYVAKYYDPEALRSNSNINFPLLRYADVLLMYAEVINELEDTPNAEAYAALNRIRNRAGLAPLENLSKEAFREALYQERRVELAFEGHRWFDLLRTDRMLDIMRANLLEEFNENNVRDHHVLYPIPLQEIQLTQGMITQNEGY